MLFALCISDLFYSHPLLILNRYIRPFLWKHETKIKPEIALQTPLRWNKKVQMKKCMENNLTFSPFRGGSRNFERGGAQNSQVPNYRVPALTPFWIRIRIVTGDTFKRQSFTRTCDEGSRSLALTREVNLATESSAPSAAERKVSASEFQSRIVPCQ